MSEPTSSCLRHVGDYRLYRIDRLFVIVDSCGIVIASYLAEHEARAFVDRAAFNAATVRSRRYQFVIETGDEA